MDLARRPGSADKAQALLMAGKIAREHPGKKGDLPKPEDILSAVPPHHGETAGTYGARLRGMGTTGVLGQYQTYAPPKPGAPHQQQVKFPRGVKPSPAERALAKSVNGGISDEWTPSSEGAQAHTTFLQTVDGTRAVRKRFTSTADYSAAEGASAEYLAGRLGTVIGAGGEPALRGEHPNEVVLGYARGQLAHGWLKTHSDAEAMQMADSDQGVRIGLLDFLDDNDDRHDLNWLVDHGKPVPIDESSTFGLPGGGWDSPFVEPMKNRVMFRQPPFDDAGMKALGQRIAAEEAEFKAAGETGWWTQVWENWQMVVNAQKAGHW
jgi:hypothetical protein